MSLREQKQIDLLKKRVDVLEQQVEFFKGDLESRLTAAIAKVIGDGLEIQAEPNTDAQLKELLNDT